MISVVICAYTMDRWDQIDAAIASVASQDLADEIILVIDHNDELFERSRRQWPQHRVVENRFSNGLSGARNTGVGEALGEIVAFLDDDAIASGNWLEALVDAFSNSTVGGVGGRVLPAWSEPPPGWFPPEFLWVVGCSYVGQPLEAAEIRNPIGANMAFRRSVFAETGGFREEIGRVGTIPLGCEETELSIRARAAGFSIWYSPDAVVQHLVTPSRTTLRYFLRRCLAEGLSKAIITTMTGRDVGLSSERTYVTRSLPAGVRRGLVQAGRGPQRASGLGSAAAICAGLLAACLGFARGSLAGKRNRTPLAAAPQIRLAPAGRS